MTENYQLECLSSLMHALQYIECIIVTSYLMIVYLDCGEQEMRRSNMGRRRFHAGPLCLFEGGKAKKRPHLRQLELDKPTEPSWDLQECPIPLSCSCILGRSVTRVKIHVGIENLRCHFLHSNSCCTAIGIGLDSTSFGILSPLQGAVEFLTKWLVFKRLLSAEKEHLAS